MSDEEKRREYDSSEPFDDSLPTGKEPIDQFYKVYGDIFSNNSKYSVRKDIPNFGDDNTPIKQVFNFYNWWYKSYESWRTFPQGTQKKLS